MKANSIPVHSNPLRRLRGPRAVLAGIAAGAALLMLGSCAERPVPVAPPPPPPPRMMPPPPPVPQAAPANWHDAPLTPGEWKYSQLESTSGANFGLPGQPPLVEITCQKQRGMLTIVPQTSAGGPVITIDTSSMRRTLTPWERVEYMPPTVSVAVNDPLLDAIAFSRGRFAIEVGAGAPTLILPARPEISRVIEDCRRP